MAGPTALKSSPAASLRERKKSQTRQAIQREALRLFLEKGYEATSVGEIAAAAGVSPMTFFRYFPTKEDVVISDDYDPLVVEMIATRPAGEPALTRVRRAVADGLARIYAADREALLVRMRLILSTPALRARLWEQQSAGVKLIASALGSRAGWEDGGLASRVTAAACIAAITTATEAWVEGGGREELPQLVEQAFDVLCRELGASNG
ncbi:MAG: TetR family transcriptional regulator [Chloroflexi bacterium]|nr:TetR family transcriptional regulator [Chloroflexota bacterium]MCL5107875.1 TetR family transcriptional regulator [Chloroflexota bacterium]